MYSGPMVYMWLTDVDGGTGGEGVVEFSDNGRLWPGQAPARCFVQNVIHVV